MRNVALSSLAPGSGRLHSRSLAEPRSASPVAPLALSEWGSSVRECPQRPTRTAPFHGDGFKEAATRIHSHSLAG